MCKRSATNVEIWEFSKLKLQNFCTVIDKFGSADNVFRKRAKCRRKDKTEGKNNIEKRNTHTKILNYPID